MALDGPKEDDDVEEVSGFTFCINKELRKMVGGVTIDITYMGFAIEPEIPLAAQGGGCGGGCGSGCGSSGGGCGGGCGSN